jgi:ABC-2 type transport system ATP-binding protein
VASALAAFAGLSTVETVSSVNGSVQLRAVPKNGAAIASDLAAFIRQKSIEVDELFVERGNLDDVFRKITTSDDGGARA